MSIKHTLRRLPWLKFPYTLFASSRREYGWDGFRAAGNIRRFVRDYGRFRELPRNQRFPVSTDQLFPCMRDWTSHTPLESTYFFQDSWAAGKIFEIKPKHHYDIGSHAPTIGIISYFVPTTMVNIRPIDLELPNLSFVEGSIVDLPFEDNSIECLSSVCVIEHIGLGRYGDPLDTFGSEKAIAEITRVIKPGGHFIVTVPVNTETRVYFNAHRAFTRDYILELLKGFDLKEEKYIYGRALFDSYDPEKGFGTGLYHVTKR